MLKQLTNFQNFIWAILLSGLTISIADSVQTHVKYQQVFADKKIIITEKMSWLDFSFLSSKKGFIRFE